ncbi:hypothetical protein ABBQ38_004503 [Trebouxia sp. C0009 RCD-2024]
MAACHLAAPCGVVIHGMDDQIPAVSSPQVVQATLLLVQTHKVYHQNVVTEMIPLVLSLRRFATHSIVVSLSDRKSAAGTVFLLVLERLIGDNLCKAALKVLAGESVHIKEPGPLVIFGTINL